MKVRRIGATAFSVALAAAWAVGVTIAPSNALAHGTHGNDARPAEQGHVPMMGHGHGQMRGHGHGSMTGQGHGSMMGPGGMRGLGGMIGHGRFAPLAEDLSVDGVRHIMGHWVAMTRNPNLKLGEVADADDDTITADVVTQDGSLVRRYLVDRHTGAMRPADMEQ
jgi:hypothetical protein